MRIRKVILPSRQGGIALEAAIALPLVFLFFAALLAGLIHEHERLHLIRAADRAASEIALVLPLLSAGREVLEPQLFDGLLDRLERDAGLASLRPDLEGELSEWVSALETYGLQVFARNRITYWLERDLALALPDRQQDVEIIWEKDRTWGWLVYTLRRPRFGLVFRTSVRSVIPVWPQRDRPAPAGGEEADGSVWDLDNFSRGQVIRRRFEANLPDDFPVIAIWNNGEATAIHSLDLTAPTYQSAGEVRRAVQRRLDQLAQFTGAQYVRQAFELTVTADQICSRRLILVIPANGSQAWLEAVLTELDQNAQSQNIRLEVMRHGASTRYEPSDNPVQPP